MAKACEEGGFCGPKLNLFLTKDEKEINDRMKEQFFAQRIPNRNNYLGNEVRLQMAYV